MLTREGMAEYAPSLCAALHFSATSALSVHGGWQEPCSDDISRAIANRLKVDLFSLIGGSQTILAASDSFFRRIVADSSINHFFAGTALAHLLAHYKMFVSALLGGPEPYTGQDIGAFHAHLCPELNDSHFDAFLKHFRAALEGVGVRDDRAERVMRVLEGKRSAVLNREGALTRQHR